MLPSTPIRHTCVGSFESQVHVLASSPSRHSLISSFRSSQLSPHIPASLMKIPKTVQNRKQSPKNLHNHTRFFFSRPSSSFESTTSPHSGPQMAKMTISTPETRAFESFRFANQLPVTPSPVAPDAPLRRQGPSHPRFAAIECLSRVRPAVPLSPLTRRLQFAEVYRRLAASTPLSSLSHVPDSPRVNLAPYSPLAFSSSVSSHSPSLANKLPDDLCSNPSDDSFEAFVARRNSKQAGVGPWVLATHSPFSCESAVVSPVASSVTDSWSPRSTSIATVSSGSPLAYRVPVLQREHTFLGALAGKRVWRFSSADKEAFLNALSRHDPHNLLQTPDNVARTASFHNWIADIPTPDAPSPPPCPSSSLSSSPSLFSPVLSSPSSPSLAEQASPRLSLPASPDPDLSFLSRTSTPASPSIRQSPAESIRSEHICSPVVKSPHSPALTDALLKLKALVAAGSPSSSLNFRSFSPVSSSSLYPASSPSSVARSASPVARSPTPVARSPSPVARSPSPTLADALAKLKTLVEAGPTSPVAHSPSPCPSPSPSPAPVVAKIDTHLVLPRPTRSLKRKLPQDASPAPRRTRPAVTRFEPPTSVFHFSPTLPESLPSFPLVLPDMPGSFPIDMPTDLRLPVTPSPTSSSVSWKAVAGIAAGAFALGLVVARYLF